MIVVTFSVAQIPPVENRLAQNGMRTYDWPFPDVANLSGQAATSGHFVAATGAGLAFLSPVLGRFGVAVSGSDTSADALFGALQVTAAASRVCPGAAGRRRQPRRCPRQDDLAAEPGHRVLRRRPRGPEGRPAAQGAHRGASDRSWSCA
ncbi:hypothetical protein QF030_003595 [Streptomyces rishiriensis]|uniref:L-lactate permease n=1 Tax=Streptomyces rishiriensis TaxID=68264 RepID=A0ABU0NQJ1_STRRH|nr:hypothetical protein [Streptomyces rishiriensis]